MKLIRANVKDVPRIMECAREFTSLIPDCPLNEGHYSRQWTKFIEHGAGAIFLLEVEDLIAGGIGGVCHPDLLSGRMQAIELFWYVKTEYRNGMWPFRLLKEFEVWAVGMKCSHVSMIHMECSMPERLKDFYVGQNYSKFETVYRKAL